MFSSVVSLLGVYFYVGDVGKKYGHSCNAVLTISITSKNLRTNKQNWWYLSNFLLPVVHWFLHIMVIFSRIISESGAMFWWKNKTLLDCHIKPVFYNVWVPYVIKLWSYKRPSHKISSHNEPDIWCFNNCELQKVLIVITKLFYL